MHPDASAMTFRDAAAARGGRGRLVACGPCGPDLPARDMARGLAGRLGDSG